MPKKTPRQNLVDRMDILWSEIIKIKENYRDAFDDKYYEHSDCQSHHLFGKSFGVRWLIENGCVLDRFNHSNIPPNSKASIALSIKLNGKEITEKLQFLSKQYRPYPLAELQEIHQKLKKYRKDICIT